LEQEMAGIKKLTVMQINNLKSGKLTDGGGLEYHANEGRRGKWIFRYSFAGRRREMGLGSYPTVSLIEARKERDRWDSVRRQGKDPVDQRKSDLREASVKGMTINDLAPLAFEARRVELRDDGNAGRWWSPVKIHVLSKLGDHLVEELHQTDIESALRPIWRTKPDAARKAMSRLNIILKHGAAMGLDVNLNAIANAKALLGDRGHISVAIPSIPWPQVPAFYQRLGNGTSELALRLLILTAVRSGPIRKAHLDQFDGDVWTIPAEGMKGRKGRTSEFRVPLSLEAINVITAASEAHRGGFLFPGAGSAGVISDMTMTGLMKRMGEEARPHGFRASFRTFLAEATDTPHDIAETAIGHVERSKVVAAYKRTDHLARRKVLAASWADHVTGVRPGSSVYEAGEGDSV
jgi:integrase